MHFDDRLATVLRLRATGERSARTQFRQLIDLLGERAGAGDRALRAAAYLRLIALGEMIPERQRADIVAENGARLRNPDLVKWFGSAAPRVAAAALYRARLTGDEWEALIPQLPLRARGFLRHRRDLPDAALRVLDRLGVQDRALPVPDYLELTELVEMAGADAGEEPTAESAPAALPVEEARAPAPAEDQEVVAESPAQSATSAPSEISAIVARIEAFQRNRTPRPAATPAPPPRPSEEQSPVLPIAGLERPAPRKPVVAFNFGTDAQGRIDWAEGDVAPMVTGIDLSALPPARGAPLDAAAAFLTRQPIRDLPVELRGGERIAGDWVCDATPRFSHAEGHFIGYVGRLRRAVSGVEEQRSAEADKLRQLLHELRTPVNAMQGYAEVIQQQLFGPTPHEYRALAATIAGDSARILAGFDELDRLARLESGALDLDAGDADFAAIARTQTAQLQTVLSPRVARFDTDFADFPARIALAQNEAEMLAWRVLASLAGAIGAGEKVSLALAPDGEAIVLKAALPALLRTASDIFSTEARAGGGTLSAGIFGAGFSLRLARAEARAAGGDLSRVADDLVLSLPLLAPSTSKNDPAAAHGRSAG